MVMVLHHEVGDHGENEHGQEDVQLDGETDEGAVCECYDEAQGFPHAVVGKRCLLVISEQNSIECCNSNDWPLVRHPSKRLWQ